MPDVAQLRTEVDALAGSLGSLMGNLVTLDEFAKKTNRLYLYQQSQIRIQNKMLKQLERLNKVNQESSKQTSKFAEETDKATESTKKLQESLKRIDEQGSEFNVRTRILSKSIKTFAHEQNKGFSIGFKSLATYRKMGGNTFEYFAEFLTSSREEVQIFGMEAAKIRKVMYGFLPPGTFRLVNKFASTLQFTGGLMRNLTLDGEETNNAYLKLFRTLMGFTSLKSLKKIFSVRDMFPKKMPALDKLEKRMEAIGEKMKALADEGKEDSDEYRELEKTQGQLGSKKEAMLASPTQKIFDDLTKASNRLADSFRKRPLALDEKRKEVEESREKLKQLRERRAKARAVGVTEASKALLEQIKAEIQIRDSLKQEANDLRPDVIIANIEDQMREQRNLINIAESEIANAQDEMFRLINSGVNDPATLSRLSAEITEAQTRRAEGEKTFSELQEEKEKATPQIFREFKTFAKSFKKFADFSISRKARQLQKGLLGIVKGVSGIIKMVFVGFLKFFVAISLILVAVLVLKKFFEKFKATEEFAKLKTFLSDLFRVVKPVFVAMFERIKDGFKLIRDAFRPGGTLKDLLLGLWKIISAILTALVFALGALVIAQLAVLVTLIGIGAKKVLDFLMQGFQKAQESFGEMLRFLATLGLIAAGIVFLVSGAWIPLLVTSLALAIVQAIRGKRTDEEKEEARQKRADRRAARKAKFSDFVESFAKGGIVNNTPLQLVGEQGPELVALPQGSRIQTAAQTKRTLANSNQTVNNFNITVNARDSSREEMRRMANEISRIISRDIQRSTTSTTLG